MKLLLFVSTFGILLSIVVLIMVLLKARKDGTPPKVRTPRDDN